MKLFSKNDIQKKKTEERAREVAQGVSLATRVNELRHTASMEEVINKTYREQSRATTEQEIAAMLAEKSQVSGELKIAKEELAEARKPLDEEWSRAHKALEYAQERSETADKKFYAAVLEEDALRKRETDATKLEGQLTSRTLSVEARENDADALFKSAAATKTGADSHAAELAKRLSHREQTVSDREVAVTNNESSNKARAEALDKREKELNERETRITDLYKTYESTHGERKS